MRQDNNMAFLGKSHKYTTFSVSHIWQNLKNRQLNKTAQTTREAYEVLEAE